VLQIEFDDVSFSDIWANLALKKITILDGIATSLVKTGFVSAASKKFKKVLTSLTEDCNQNPSNCRRL